MNNTYRINTLYPTIQGEGCLTGVPMILVRLQGCGVGCPWCDTKETWNPNQGQALSSEEIVEWAKKYPGPKWILLTGGEPAEQNLDGLVITLHQAGYKVALETSGTALGHLFPWTCGPLDWLCVSPKIDMPGGKPILKKAVEKADEIKFVVGKPSDLPQLDQFIADFGPFKLGTEICLQPLSQSDKATALCVETVIEKGWRLSLQTHKSIGLD